MFGDSYRLECFKKKSYRSEISDNGWNVLVKVPYLLVTVFLFHEIYKYFGFY